MYRSLSAAFCCLFYLDNEEVFLGIITIITSDTYKVDKIWIHDEKIHRLLFPHSEEPVDCFVC